MICRQQTFSHPRPVCEGNRHKPKQRPYLTFWVAIDHTRTYGKKSLDRTRYRFLPSPLTYLLFLIPETKLNCVLDLRGTCVSILLSAPSLPTTRVVIHVRLHREP